MFLSGGYTWEGLFRDVPIEECPADQTPKILPTIFNDNDDKSVVQTAHEFHLALDSLKQVCRRSIKQFIAKETTNFSLEQTI